MTTLAEELERIDHGRHWGDRLAWARGVVVDLLTSKGPAAESTIGGEVYVCGIRDNVSGPSTSIDAAAGLGYAAILTLYNDGIISIHKHGVPRQSHPAEFPRHTWKLAEV